MASAETQKRVMIAVGVIALIGIGAAAILFSRDPEKNIVKSVSVTVWGPLDEEGMFNKVPQDLFPPNFHIKYIKKDPTTYDEDLLRAFAMGPNQPNAPDIFYVKNSSIPRYLPYIQASTFPTLYTDFKSRFVDVAISDFTDGAGSVYGVPLFVDSLALFWNKELFNSVGLELPPKTWPEVQNDVVKLTKKDIALNIIRSAISLGESSNINHSAQILYALMMQSDVPMNRAQGRALTAANVTANAINPINFYLEFSDPKKAVYTWNKQLHQSFDLFSEGRLAMTFGYSYEMARLRAKNPYLVFDVAEFPQLEENPDKKVTHADYWGMVAWNRSLRKDDAWSVLAQFMKDESQKRYAEVFNRPTAIRSLVPVQETDPKLGVFAKQSLYAKSWRIVDDRIIETYFNEAIAAILRREMTTQMALQKLEDKINLVVQQRAELEANK